MTDKDFEQPDPGEERGYEVPGDDPDVDSSPQGPDEATGSSPQGDDLTVDDILGAQQNADAAAEDAAIADLESALLLDLKRLQAEYANYRRRTEEQRQIESDRAQGAVAKGLLPVLDDLDRAEKHGDLLDGTPFFAIAEKLRTIVSRLGIESYGEAGEAFDPQQHQAIFQAPTPGTTQATILEVVEAGYRLGSVELRPAKVVVAVPAE